MAALQISASRLSGNVTHPLQFTLAHSSVLYNHANIINPVSRESASGARATWTLQPALVLPAVPPSTDPRSTGAGGVLGAARGGADSSVGWDSWDLATAAGTVKERERERD